MEEAKAPILNIASMEPPKGGVMSTLRRIMRYAYPGTQQNKYAPRQHTGGVTPSHPRQTPRARKGPQIMTTKDPEGKPSRTTKEVHARYNAKRGPGFRPRLSDTTACIVRAFAAEFGVGANEITSLAIHLAERSGALRQTLEIARKASENF